MWKSRLLYTVVLLENAYAMYYGGAAMGYRIIEETHLRVLKDYHDRTMPIVSRLVFLTFWNIVSSHL